MEYLKEYFHLFEMDGMCYLYNCKCKQAMIVERNIYEKLLNEETDVWKLFQTEFEKYDVIEEQPLKRNTYELFLMVSNDCNANCVYCFAQQGSYGKKREIMSEEISRKSVDLNYSWNRI